MTNLPTNLRTWFTPLDTCKSLDEIRSAWEILLEQNFLTASYTDDRYRDSILSFLGRSPLPANLKLAAVLAFVDPLYFDARLALGVLADELDSCPVQPSARTGALDGMHLDLRCNDRWLHGYVHGRMIEVSASLRSERDNFSKWRGLFWNEFLLMSCRWADVAGVRHAAINGAALNYKEHLPAATAAGGMNVHWGRASHTPGQDNAEYRLVIDTLIELGIDIREAATSALGAAASVGNLDLVTHLVAKGADIHAENEDALLSAAANRHTPIVEWLLGKGVNVHAANEGALMAAIESLCTATVEILLDAGANLRELAERALKAAFTSMPYELYAGECHDFIPQRADMIALLHGRGASFSGLEDDPSVKNTPYIRELVSYLLRHDMLDPDARPTIQAIADAARIR